MNEPLKLLDVVDVIYPDGAPSKIRRGKIASVIDTDRFDLEFDDEKGRAHGHRPFHESQLRRVDGPTD